MKERETNRVRATATLVQEAFEAAKGGRPVSVAAIKGFVTSWLFPRTVVIVGSLLGGIVLVAQTYILWNQTRLLDLQAKAAQLEQVVKIRDRLAAVSAYATALARLKAAYTREINLPPCSVAACTANVVQTTLRGLREDIPELPPSEARVVWLSLSEQLTAIARDTDRIARQPQVGIHADLPNNLAAVTDLIRPAATYCLLEGSKLALLVEQANAFALLAENAVWIKQPLDKPDQYVASYKQFPQIRGNTQVALIQYEEAIDGVIAVVRSSSNKPAKRDGTDDDYTLPSYIQDVRTLHSGLLSSLNELAEACARLSEQDKAALGAIDMATSD